MLIDPHQFANLLKHSTLDSSEQRSLLNLLPSLSVEEIQRIAEILKRDVALKNKVIADIYGRRDALLLKFDLELEKLKAQAK